MRGVGKAGGWGLGEGETCSPKCDIVALGSYFCLLGGGTRFFPFLLLPVSFLLALH